MFADVIVDITNSEVDKVFEYSFTDCRITSGSRVVVPFGNKVIEGIVIEVKSQSKYPIERIKPILRLLEETPALTDETLKLMQFVCDTCYVPRASALRLFLPTEMRKGRVKEQFTKFVCLNEEIDLDAVLSSMRKSAVKQKDLLLFLSENGRQTFTKMNNDFGASAVKSVVEKGYAYFVEEKYARSPYKNLTVADKNVVLTPKQQSAVDSVIGTDKLVSLLFGVTGSGKTEVYLNLINYTINKGKTAIMLVPEIALTPQMLKQLRARFGDYAAIIHSGLSAGERFDEWWRIRNGEARIVIGARSAIFAPISDLGLIIIDEEHDGSYTSESSPRYSTIDIAKFRAEFNGAKVILGSATPTYESYARGLKGVYKLLTLSKRVNDAKLPSIQT